jgi:hypothetical protein
MEARKTSEKALVAVIQEAWIDDLIQARGLSGIGQPSKMVLLSGPSISTQRPATILN